MERQRQTSLSCPADQPPWSQAIPVLHLLVDAGHEAFLVGGCVRDLLIGRAVQDVDIATSAHPQQVEACCQHAGLRCIAVGRSFGVVVVVTCDGTHVEVATFRHDGAYIDGRKPVDITYCSSAHDDVWRRDFTVNALLLDPLSDTLTDYVAGLEDVHSRTLRCVGAAATRLREDRLRILRGLRFAAQIGLTIEPNTWQAICTTTLEGLSVERLVQEWLKGLCGPHRGTWLALLRTSGHLAELCAPLAVCDAVALEGLGHSLDRIAADAPVSVRAAVWLAPARDSAASWLTRLPTALATRIAWLLDQVWKSPDLLTSLPARRRRVLQHDAAGELVSVVQARAQTAEEHVHATALAQAWQQELATGPWQRLIGAKDLMPLGVSSGPALGALIRVLEDAQLAGRFHTQEEGLAFAAVLLARRCPDGK